MNRKSLALFAGALFAAVIVGVYLAASAATPTAAQGKDKLLKIGVVNVAEVFDKFNERIKRERELKTRSEGLKFEVESLKKKAEELASEMERLDKNSEEYHKKQERLIRIASEMQITAEKGKSDLTKHGLSDRQELYAMIREAITKYAGQNGYDLILKTDDMRVTGKSAVTQDIQMSLRIVLHNTRAMDLTRTIIDVLNK